jgi:uncharacterized protein
MPPAVTLVIPVLLDADAASALLASLPASADLEIIVVDGAADPKLRATMASHPAATLRQSGVGRARQMNAGAAGSTGEWLLFLHADSVLPPDWLPALVGLEDDVLGGWFQFRLDDSAWQARVIEWLTRWRVRHLQLPYGDQGLFVRRRVFDELGGYRDLPFMEDVEFVRRLVRAGRVSELPLPLRTSSRRWRGEGWFRRSGKNLALVSLYLLGVSPFRLARWYRSAPRE